MLFSNLETARKLHIYFGSKNWLTVNVILLFNTLHAWPPCFPIHVRLCDFKGKQIILQTLLSELRVTRLRTCFGKIFGIFTENLDQRTYQ